MDPTNCVGLYHWARDLGATGLADCALRYLCQHFAQVGLSVLVVYTGKQQQQVHDSCIIFYQPLPFSIFQLLNTATRGQKSLFLFLHC